MNSTDKISAAVKDGKLMASAADNLNAWLKGGLPAWAQSSLAELIERGEWSELNDRFYRYLEFGTGGMRGRTIGRVAAKAETGTLSATGSPEHANVGSNLLNEFTLTRAVIGLHRYIAKYLATQQSSAKPKIVIAHDIRHFSRHFCELAASTWTKLGGEAVIFDGPRSTPQLSFSVRHLKAHTGVVITASHNPPHDNGFKAYFDDGAQVTPPHDKGIIAEVDAVPLSAVHGFLTKDVTKVVTLGSQADAAYLATAAQALLDPTVIRKTPLKVVYTNIHGVGAVSAIPLLRQAGVDVTPVPEQLAFDPRFPTVKSPNPENAEAMTLALALANKGGHDLVMATDPDDDRMGAAVRNKAGGLELLTGNQVGALMADYRIAKYKELGWIPAAGTQSAAIVKTFVTTPLQDAIGAGHKVKVINTLTGFKWIAGKMRGYEEKLVQAMGPGFDYDQTPFKERAALLQKHSTFYLFGTEESYGYLPNDLLRDKDGNAACLMFAEVCAWVKSRGLTVPEYLDEIYLKYGFFLEGVINIYYEGASGAAKIKRILDTYRSAPPKAFGDTKVTKFQDFGREKFHDADGERIPAQDLYLVTLANGYSFAARGSGTEPKMKFYLFAQEPVKSAADLPAAKAKARATLDALKAMMEADARKRAEPPSP
ncbi:phospho-sugar mutase [Opitutus sp. GAS368]|uniref:phospho-sugar mutase n=1 Tax=Opitutus sp. GAS368 TaxID=1882749 RepID=UPI00087B3850|nr:phospho-sugar mutase [Opitutus sp. GAS368]SDS49778.1 phosphoglucomutase [Opitutus sp. GAS368]